MTTQTQLVTGVDFAMVPTTDIERSVAFYTETLGLPCTARYGKVDGAEFETGNLTIAAFDFGAVGLEPPSANRGPIALRVDDVAAARAELESRGVEFQGDIVDSGVCHQAYFADPDGNNLILHHRYAPR
ncbi:MAG TPA: VOC family protein [Thermoleophilaceae bacterium]|nr:VOC family protein [Thermoleophilaceae bacterium]